MPNVVREYMISSSSRRKPGSKVLNFLYSGFRRNDASSIFQGSLGVKSRCLLAVAMLTMAVTSVAQTCRSESEIPSTTPTGDFHDNGDGTVTHKTTGLMWTKCALGQTGSDCSGGSALSYDWRGALQAAADSRIAGHADWRLPNVKELRSIVEQRCFDPAINTTVFPSLPVSNVWSSSPFTDFPVNTPTSWGINFSEFGYNFTYDRDELLSLRMVRSVR